MGLEFCREETSLSVVDRRIARGSREETIAHIDAWLRDIDQALLVQSQCGVS